MNILNAIVGVFQSPALNAALWGFAASFALCVLLVLTKRWQRRARKRAHRRRAGY